MMSRNGADRSAVCVMGRQRPGGVDAGQPNLARVYNRLLGGKDNFAADRECVDGILKIVPQFGHIAHANRRFMERTVRYLARMGITQFLELGSGLPARPNVHEVAQAVIPGTRVAYVDNDPVVVSHGHALLAVDGATTMIEADLRDPVALLHRQTLLDLEQPVAVLLFSVLDHINDGDDPAGIVAWLMSQVASGSHLVLSHFTNDFDRDTCTTLADFTHENDISMTIRSHEDIQGFFSGLTLLEPGLVQLPQWRPSLRRSDTKIRPATDRIWAYGGVARKP
ncbi:SAM-dependent methyltransferase [Spirillospora sp. CA-128828]|uniref:SAM-dependent methyltransferase n=1 Tax=Spirillospora sp. CA-128828 TaxID=3240033 RepID=UPI003D90415B